MKTTDITTKTQAAAGYTVIRRSVNVGHSATTGVTHDRIESTYEVRHEGRSVDTVTRKSDIALAILTFEGRACQDGTADAIEGGCVTASEDVTDAAVLCTYRPVTRRCA